MSKYIVVAIELHTNCQRQASDPHTWDECEAIYLDYQESYENCRVVIVPVKKAGSEEGS